MRRVVLLEDKYSVTDDPGKRCIIRKNTTATVLEYSGNLVFIETDIYRNRYIMDLHNVQVFDALQYGRGSEMYRATAEQLAEWSCPNIMKVDLCRISYFNTVRVYLVKDKKDAIVPEDWWFFKREDDSIYFQESPIPIIE